MVKAIIYISRRISDGYVTPINYYILNTSHAYENSMTSLSLNLGDNEGFEIFIGSQILKKDFIDTWDHDIELLELINDEDDLVNIFERMNHWNSIVNK